MPFLGFSKKGGGAKVIDPVCQMGVDPKKAAANYTYKGTTYYFCALACQKQFEKDPAKYLGATGKA